MSNQQRKKAKPGDPLTPREQNLHALLCAGHSTETAAKALGITRWTAKLHRKQINRKHRPTISPV